MIQMKFLHFNTVHRVLFLTDYATCIKENNLWKTLNFVKERNNLPKNNNSLMQQCVDPKACVLSKNLFLAYFVKDTLQIHVNIQIATNSLVLVCVIMTSCYNVCFIMRHTKKQ